MRRAGEAHGIDLLVNNAGGQFFSPATLINRKGWDAVIDVNLSAVFTVTRAAHPYLKARQGTVVTLPLEELFPAGFEAFRRDFMGQALCGSGLRTGARETIMRSGLCP